MSIELIIGPMFAGKTTELLRRANRYTYGGKNVLLVRSETDTRKQGTHDGNRFTCAVQAVHMLGDVRTAGYGVICVDEAQFFPDLVKVVKIWCEVYGLRVVVAGLNSNWKRKPFGDVLQLCCLADSVDLLNAVCACGRCALFSHRTSGSLEDVDIGSTDKYVPVCRVCYLDKS